MERERVYCCCCCTTRELKKRRRRRIWKKGRKKEQETTAEKTEEGATGSDSAPTFPPGTLRLREAGNILLLLILHLFFYSIILISDELHCSQRIVSRSRRRDSHSSRLFFSRLVRIRGAALTAPCTPICATYCARDLPFSFFFLKSAVFLVRRPFRV